MTIRGGGDPPLNPWLPGRCEEWARRLGASPPDAHDCIMVPILTDRPNTRLWRDLRPLTASSPRNCRRLPARQESSCPTNAACRRARDRQGQVASQRPAAALDRHCARWPGRSQVGTRRWSPSGPNKEMGIGRRSSLTSIAPYKGYGCRPFCARWRALGRRPEASRERTRGVEIAAASLWGFDGSAWSYVAAAMRLVGGDG
jgi:hypothetical protein